MRLIAPFIIALLGAAIGLLINRLFIKSGIAPQIAAVIGAVSAFAGLILRDVFDVEFVSDPLFNTLFASLLCALIVSILAHAVAMFSSGKKSPD